MRKKAMTKKELVLLAKKIEWECGQIGSELQPIRHNCDLLRDMDLNELPINNQIKMLFEKIYDDVLKLKNGLSLNKVIKDNHALYTNKNFNNNLRALIELTSKKKCKQLPLKDDKYYDFLNV